MPELVLRRFLLVLLVLLVFLLLLLLLLPLLLLVPFPFLRSLWLLALRRYWRVLLLRLRHFVWCRSLRLRLLWLPVWLLTLVLFWPLVRCRLGRWRTILSGRWFTRSIGVGPVRLRSVRRRAICIWPVRKPAALFDNRSVTKDQNAPLPAGGGAKPEALGERDSLSQW